MYADAKARIYEAALDSSRTYKEAATKIGIDPATLWRYRQTRKAKIVELEPNQERIPDRHLLRTYLRMRDREIDSTLECLREMRILQQDIKRRG
jgi:transposase-like protein